VSLHAPVGEDEAELGDFLVDEEAPSPFEQTAQVLDRAAIDDALENLPGHERRVLRLRYGLDDGRARTMHQVARELRLSADRVRRLEEQALVKLRTLPETERLRDAA
jgi:RNA polymerase primary sigma factor